MFTWTAALAGCEAAANERPVAATAPTTSFFQFSMIVPPEKSPDDLASGRTMAAPA
jgi:hypothetical protein